ncbi:restriction endonuclease [Pseudomonas sp. Irchel s3f19]|uniref:restriction endonuclease n=1 Tax=Pseudomonas sp. Irchel s3f19 TaxID=2009146 RepID=UPI000BA45080|nr:restriction endonuclease [Pseudomonas sp. Irchel s3f19]
MASDDPEWIIPSSIPFDELKGKDLEECVYWLLDAMGAQDIEWRIGGSGGGAADGGRDLEAKILVPSADGDLSPKTYWFECKGRSKTVESEVVKQAAFNALAFDVDVVVVVTNSTFTNPTADWVKSWNCKYAMQVQLWDKTKLERLLSKQPRAVLRLFGQSLSLAGRLQALSSRFWNRFEYSPSSTLEVLWERQHEITIGPLERFALIANECATETLEQRPWAAAGSDADAVETLFIGLANVYYLFFRAMESGANQTPLFRALIYVVLQAGRDHQPSDIAKIFDVFLSEWNDRPMPEGVTKMVVEPFLQNLLVELQEICTPTCRRLHRARRAELTPDGKNMASYWYRFTPDGAPVPSDEPMLWLIETSRSCDIGYPVDEERNCPLIDTEPSISEIERILEAAQRVVAHRMGYWQDEQARKKST